MVLCCNRGDLWLDGGLSSGNSYNNGHTVEVLKIGKELEGQILETPSDLVPPSGANLSRRHAIHCDMVKAVKDLLYASFDCRLDTFWVLG